MSSIAPNKCKCAVSHIAIRLLYFDLRIRREGLDIALTAVRREEEVATSP